MFHSVSLLSQAPLARGSRALPSVLFIHFFIILFSYSTFNPLIKVLFFVCFCFHLYVHVCMCESEMRQEHLMVFDRSTFWAEWHHCILYSTCIIHVYLKKNRIKIIMTKYVNFFLSQIGINQIIIIFMFGFHGNK